MLVMDVRARQFSSFVLMIGTIAAADEFKPTAALIVKDKDSLLIPLILETIPSAKEFADATASLSPEQQRFCKARAMPARPQRRPPVPAPSHRSAHGSTRDARVRITRPRARLRAPGLDPRDAPQLSNRTAPVCLCSDPLRPLSLGVGGVGRRRLSARCSWQGRSSRYAWCR